jgi:AraC-like DNA-binding protein
MPFTHLKTVCDTEGARQAVDLRIMPVFRDALLLAYALRLVIAETIGPVQEDVGSEIAARQLLVRLAVATGGRSPDWISDASVFTPSVMRQIMERVDARLTGHPTLAEMSSGFGLSPSHFARKFHYSTGLSLNRFMNRRRIGLSLAILKAGRTPLAQLSLDLGFSLQASRRTSSSGLNAAPVANWSSTPCNTVGDARLEESSVPTIRYSCPTAMSSA